jgi:hypothetical protein
MPHKTVKITDVRVTAWIVHGVGREYTGTITYPMSVVHEFHIRETSLCEAYMVTEGLPGATVADILGRFRSLPEYQPLEPLGVAS